MDLGRLLSYQGLHYVPSTNTPTINWSGQQPLTYNRYSPTHPDQDENRSVWSECVTMTKKNVQVEEL